MEPSVLSSPRPFSSCRSNMCVHAPLLIGNSIFNKCTQIDFQLGAFKRSYETQSQARTHTHQLFLPPHTPLTHTCIKCKTFQFTFCCFSGIKYPVLSKVFAERFSILGMGSDPIRFDSIVGALLSPHSLLDFFFFCF